MSFWRRKKDRELEEEVKNHLKMAAKDRVERGEARKDAESAARREFGNEELVKETARDTWGWRWIEDFFEDARFGLRIFRKTPGFAAITILTLALGIGANTAIFQLLDAVRLRTLPVKNAEQIARVAIDHRNGASGHFSSGYSDLTYAMWEQIRAQQQGFSLIFAWGPTTFNISPGGEVHNVPGIWASSDFFSTLGVEPALGRLFTQEDDQSGCTSPNVVISYSFWQQEFGGQRSVLGHSITISRHPFAIVGVAPSDFYGVEVGRYFDVAAPLCAEPLVNGEEDSQLKRRAGWWLSVLGRLKPGWSIERAAAQLRAASPGIFEATLPAEFNPEYANHFLQYKLGVFSADSGLSEVRTDYQASLCLLLALAGLVLLIASANLANLLLARASAREKEMGMRMAVGATRGRLLRQLLAESLLLAAIGAGLGALLAGNLSSVLVSSLSTQNDPLFLDLNMDWRVLGFTAGLAALTCVLFGLAPALRTTRVAPGVVLQEGTRGVTQGRSRLGLQRVLVVSQIALSLTLLVGALLFARSLNKLAGLDAGFRQRGILVTGLDFSTLNLSTERRREFSNELLNRVRALPGVESAAKAAIVPLGGDGIGHDILLGNKEEAFGEAPVAAFNIISPGYFETLETKLLAGRDFDERDTPGSPNVAIVSETFAKKFAKGGNPLGMKFHVREMKKISLYEVIGLVQDTKYSDLREDFFPIVYTALSQYDRPGTYAQIVIRSRAPLAGLIASIKRTALEANPNMDITFSTLSKTIADGLVRDRLMAQLSGFFGVLAVLLAVIGLYGVISYTVARRRNEIAIRMAMGASRENILKMVMREAAIVLAVGLVIGIALALAGGNLAESMLFGLKPWDLATFAMALAMLTLVAAVASLLPALRASRLDPMVALRQD